MGSTTSKGPGEPLIGLLADKDMRGAAIGFRDGLRDARAAVLADAEDFMAVVIAIEALGHWLQPAGHNLGAYTPALVALVTRTGVAAPDAFARDLRVLRETRNDTAHQGVAARHAADEALRVAVVLEGALTVLHQPRWGDVTAQELMTANPTEAFPWQQVADVRRVMLVRGFTALPFRTSESEDWRVLTDQALAAWLNSKPDERQSRLDMRLAVAMKEGLTPDVAKCVALTAKVGHVATLVGLRLVTVDGTDKGDLRGVIAPSDLL